MNNEDKILALLEQMNVRHDRTDKILDILAEGQIRLEKELSELKETVARIDNTVIRIENDHGKKLDALFDGYQQNASKLQRIEEKVQQQDEFILRRVK